MCVCECRRYGFAVFESEESMNVVLSPDNIANHVIDGHKVEVKKSIPHAIHQVRGEGDKEGAEFASICWCV